MNERVVNEELVDRVLIGRARNAAHACLYFLYHFASTGSATVDEELAADRNVATNRVRALIDGVHLPPNVAEAALEESLPLGAGPSGAAMGVSERVYKLGFEAAAPDVTRDSVIEHWARQIWRPVREMGDQVAPAAVDDLVQRLQHFLTISRRHSERDQVDRLVTRIGRGVARNAALLCGLVVATLVYGKLEAVHSLVANMPWRALMFPFGLVLGGLILVLAMNRWPSLHVGKEAFWRIAHPALPPVGMDLVGCGPRIGVVIGRAEALKLGALILWLVVSGALFGGVVAVQGFERTQNTLLLLNSVCLLLLIALHWIDHWDFLDRRPIRLYGLGVALVVLSLVLSGYWAQLQLWVSLIPLGFVVWWAWDAATERRITWGRTVGSGFAVLLFLSMVVGSRTRERQVWGTKAHDEHRLSVGEAGAMGATRTPKAEVAIGQWPMGSGPVVLLAASGGGSRAAVYAGYVLERLHRDAPEVARNLQAISSVSGGSLASASYIAFRKELYEKTRSTEFWPKEAEELGEQCSDARLGLKDGELVRAVGTDFLYPTLKGALVPSLGRGEAIEQSFAEDAKIGHSRLSDLAGAWQKASGAGEVPFPLPLFNSCTLDAHAVVISPLARDYYLSSAAGPDGRRKRFERLRAWYGMTKQDALTWVLDRDAILALSDLNRLYDPSVVEAVRASANFPFGFPLVDVSTPEYGDPYVKDQTEVRLTDGGVLSNSGLWTLYQLMAGPGVLQPEQRQVADTLMERGVLLLIVEASHMPEYADNRRDLLTLYGAISDQAPVAQSLHARMFDLLAKQYGRRLEIVQIDIVPTPDDNVLTTWALDDESKAKLRRSFCRVWYSRTGQGDVADEANTTQPKGILAEIKTRWKRLQDAEIDKDARVASMYPPAFTRPPLD